MYSIGMLKGEENSPLDLFRITESARQVVTPTMVGDIGADYVADPFLLCRESEWFLFFEVLPRARAARIRNGLIAYASSRDEGRTWTYGQVVLREPFHLSYPYVFEWQGQAFMVPESHESREVSLYRATEFPARWQKAAVLLRGDFTDASPFHYRGSWWMFAESARPGARWRGEKADLALRLYFADELAGPWTEHPSSPVVSSDARLRRPAGRVICDDDGRLWRFAQDATAQYGTAVYAVAIEKLTRSEYEERPVGQEPLLAGAGAGWNAGGMHHIDLHKLGNRWIAMVDGWELQAVD